MSHQVRPITVVISALCATEGHLSEREAADSIFRSTRRLRAIVLENTGMSYRMLRLLVKMDFARKLLRETNLSVRAISERLRYSCSRKFTQSFKRGIGFSPTEYRTLHLLLSLHIVPVPSKNGHSGASTGPQSERSMPAPTTRAGEGS